MASPDPASADTAAVTDADYGEDEHKSVLVGSSGGLKQLAAPDADGE